jgi:serine/threonine protein kinase
MGNCCSNEDPIKGKTPNSSFINEKLQLQVEYKSKKDILLLYDFIQKIRDGYNSSIFLAKNPIDKLVVIKIIRKSRFFNLEEMKKFVKKHKFLIGLKNKFILQTFKIFQSQNRFFVELEYTANGNILNLINNYQLNLEEIKLISAQIILGLIYLHKRGMVFGDLNPENIFINKKGFIKLRKKTICNQEKSILNETLEGTLYYIAPEYFYRGKPNKKSDFYALGVLLYFLTFHKYPFEYINPEEFFKINPEPKIKYYQNKNFDITPEYKEFLEKLLEIDSNKRIGDNFEDFKKLLFFKNFDWDEISTRKKKFSYVKKIQKNFFLSSENLSISENLYQKKNIDLKTKKNKLFLKSFKSKICLSEKNDFDSKNSDYMDYDMHHKTLSTYNE